MTKPERTDSGRPKNNPKSLLWLLGQLMGENDSVFGNRWAQFLQGKSRYTSFGATPRNLRNLARLIKTDRTALLYWHLESIAHLVGLPAGLLLIFSRIRSNYDYGHAGDTLAIRDALLKIAATINPDEEPTLETLECWVEILAVQGGYINEPTDPARLA